jgi:hypothetical protein
LRTDQHRRSQQTPMKHIVTLSLLLLAGARVGAQDIITLRDEDNNVVNGTLVTHHGMADESVLEQDITATLVTGPTRNVNVRRYELDVQAGTQNYFCWGVCYGPQDAGALPVWQSLPQHSLNMEAGTTLTNFHGYHAPMGMEGSSTYRYVWFDVANPDDSAWVDIEFHVMAVGIEEQVSGVRSMAVFPNPSLGNDVEFTIDMTGTAQNTSLVVYNMLGERVHSTALRATQTRSTLATAGLSSGVYFATVERNGSALATRRFVIAGR